MKIEINKLTKIYGEGTNAVVALSELDLEIAAGEVCIVRGPNGSGKTTLVSILAGEVSSTAGTIKLSKESEQKPKIAVVNQFNNLINELTIAEHFKILGRSENLVLIDPEILERKPIEISRGQAQIVAVALALFSDVDLLLADEPTGALGQAESEVVYQFIKKTAIKNTAAVLLVTHDDSAEVIADRVVRLRDGRISETWKPGQVEKQVVNGRGWVKLPEIVTNGLASEVRIEPSNLGATVEGRISAPSISDSTTVKKIIHSDIAICVENLGATYQNHQVFSDLTFRVNRGSLFSIYGKSGAGKTTLLRSLLGIHTDIQGTIRVEQNLEIAYFNIENIYGLELKIAELDIDQNLIDKLQLRELANRPLNTFSGGQKQRLIVALALSSPAEILLLDEPTSALDSEMTELVINALVQSNKTIIAATHDPELVSAASDGLKI